MNEARARASVPGSCSPLWSLPDPGLFCFSHHLSDKYLLSTHDIPGPVPGIRDVELRGNGGAVCAAFQPNEDIFLFSPSTSPARLHLPLFWSGPHDESLHSSLIDTHNLLFLPCQSFGLNQPHCYLSFPVLSSLSSLEKVYVQRERGEPRQSGRSVCVCACVCV